MASWVSKGELWYKISKMNGTVGPFDITPLQASSLNRRLSAFVSLFSLRLKINHSVFRAGDADFCVTIVKSRKLDEAGLSCTQDGSHITTRDCP